MKSSEFFESIPQTAVKVGPHNTFYPVFYRDTAYMSVFLLAPLDKVKSLLPKTDAPFSADTLARYNFILKINRK